MKIKKTLALVVTAAMSLATMTGCSQASTNYVSELSKTSEWTSAQSECTGKVSVKANGLAEDINFTSTTYTSDNKGYGNIKFSDTAGLINLPEMDFYTDGSTAYINKSYYEGLFTVEGQEIPEALKNIKADYIGIDSGVDTASLQAALSNPESIIKLSKSIFGDSDIDIPYVQNGREYTVDLNSDQAIDLGVKGIKAVSNNIENVNKTFTLGLNQDQLNELKTAVADQSFDTVVGQLKEALKGSTLKTKEVFADDKYTVDVNANIVVKDKCTVDVTVNGTTTKAAAKEITIPQNVVKMTQEEFSKLIMPQEEAVVNNSSLAKTIEAA